jgi:hypothetical protein
MSTDGRRATVHADDLVEMRKLTHPHGPWATVMDAMRNNTLFRPFLFQRDEKTTDDKRGTASLSRRVSSRLLVVSFST